MKILKKYSNGIYILKFEIWRFEFLWFTDCGEWFIYLRYKEPSWHCIFVTEHRFSSAGNIYNRKYVLK